MHGLYQAAAKTRQMFPLRNIWTRILALREVSKASIVIELILGIHLGQLLKVELISQHGADATEALDELVALTRTVRDEFERRAEVLVALGKPLEEGALVDEFHFLSRLFVREHFAVGFLALVGVENDFGSGGGFQDPAGDFQVLVNDKGLAGAGLHGFERVVDAVAYFAAVEADFVEVFPDELLLLYELDVAEGFSCELDGLIETVLATVGDVDYFDHFGLQAVVKHVGLVEVVLEVCRSCKDQTGDVDFVLGDVILHSQFGHLAHIVVALLFSQSGETKGGLTTTTVLLRQVDGEFVDDISGVATKCTEESTVSIHDDEAELLVGFEQFAQGFGVKFVITQIQGGVDWLEWLKVNVDLSFLSFRGYDFTAVDDKTVGRDLVVELEALLSGCDGGQDRQSVDS